MQTTFTRCIGASVHGARQGAALNTSLLSRSASSQEGEDPSKKAESSVAEFGGESENPPRKKTTIEQDEELRKKLEAISGGGGEAGLELEDGKPVAIKRGVKENLFRVI